MCGRFTLIVPPELLAEIFGLDAPCPVTPRYNIAPSQQIAVVRRSNGERNELAFLKWGLHPHWDKNGRSASGMINARAETVGDKPLFRAAVRTRRCIIPASGFFEWHRQGKQRIPHYIRPKEGGLLGFAGIWEPGSGAGQTETCAILTTAANDLVRQLHERMPLILDRSHFDRWLDPHVADPALLRNHCLPFPAERLTMEEVAKEVNSVANDSPACLRRVEGDLPLFSAG